MYFEAEAMAGAVEEPLHAAILPAGLVAAGGEELAFSIVVNNMVRIRRARQAQDRMGVLLARLDRGDLQGAEATGR